VTGHARGADRRGARSGWRPRQPRDVDLCTCQTSAWSVSLNAWEGTDRGCGRVVTRVLLVEDDEAIAEVVGLILHESGYVVDRVSNVADALISVHSECPAAVLLDLTLPVMSGISFLKTCRESATLASLPIVLLTGAPIPVLEDGLEPDAILTKPFDIDHLCTTLDRLTQGPRSAVVDAVSRA
jgi:CheY-like chemotaxis protein